MRKAINRSIADRFRLFRTRNRYRSIIEPVCLIVCDVQYRGPQTAGRKPRIQGRIRATGALAGAVLIGLDRLAHLNLIERASFPSDRKRKRVREKGGGEGARERNRAIPERVSFLEAYLAPFPRRR